MKLTRGFKAPRPETRFGDTTFVGSLPSDTKKLLSILIPKPLLPPTPTLPSTYFILLEDDGNIDTESSESLVLETFV